MAQSGKTAKASPAAVPVEVIVPALPVATPTTFGGPNSGNLGWDGIAPPRPLTGGTSAPFTLDPKRG